MSRQSPLQKRTHLLSQSETQNGARSPLLDEILEAEAPMEALPDDLPSRALPTTGATIQQEPRRSSSPKKPTPKATGMSYLPFQCPHTFETHTSRPLCPPKLTFHHSSCLSLRLRP